MAGVAMVSKCRSIPCSKLEDILGNKKSVSATEHKLCLALQLADRMDTGQNVLGYLAGVGLIRIPSLTFVLSPLDL